MTFIGKVIFSKFFICVLNKVNERWNIRLELYKVTIVFCNPEITCTYKGESLVKPNVHALSVDAIVIYTNALLRVPLEVASPYKLCLLYFLYIWLPDM